MGLFKKIKKVFKGVKKTFKGIGKAFGKLMNNKVFRIVAIGAALVFTAGAAAGAFGLTTGSGLLGALSSNGLTSGVFAAGQSFGTAAAGMFGAAGTAGTAATAAPGVAAPSVTAASTGAGATSGLGAVAPGVSPQVAAAASGMGAGGGAIAPTVQGGGILAKVGAAAGKVGAYAVENPGAALLAGNMIQGATEMSDDELAERALRRERRMDNRFGVNNLSGRVGVDVTQDGQAFENAGNAYTQGLLERVRAQREQNAANQPGIAAPGAYNPTYSAPPPVQKPTGSV